MARKKELTLVAAKKPQLKKRARRDWSKAKADRFLAVLGDSCNVSEACRRSGVPMTVAYRRRKMDAGFRAEVAESTPLQRWGRPEDVAAAALWLASPGAAFITGQAVNVNGGVVV